LETERKDFLVNMEECIAKARREAATAVHIAQQETQRRVAVEDEIGSMQQAVTDAQASAESAAEECSQLRSAVIAVSEVCIADSWETTGARNRAPNMYHAHDLMTRFCQKQS
jgi:hypothetical protein